MAPREEGEGGRAGGVGARADSDVQLRAVGRMDG